MKVRLPPCFLVLCIVLLTQSAADGLSPHGFLFIPSWVGSVIRQQSFWIMFSVTLIFNVGIGATTIYVIGAPYLDDSIPNNESPFYFGKSEYD